MTRIEHLSSSARARTFLVNPLPCQAIDGMGVPNEIRFVNFQGPGQECSAAEAKITRQHVRRAVMRKRKSSDLHDRIKHFDGVTFLSRISAQNVPKSRLMVIKATNNSQRKDPNEQQALRSLREPSDCSGKPVSSCREEVPDLLVARLTARHCYTRYAASGVEIPVGRIDFLFKSYAYRNAAEPLFDTSHVDSHLRMDAVFPGCLEATAFLNALVYSMVQIANMGRPTTEALRLKGKALECLRAATSSADQALTYSDIGAIMILKGDAYRWNDHEAHKAHTQGLSRVIQFSDRKLSCLTALAERAVFWQDVNAALLFDSEPRASHLALPQVRWHRECRPGPRKIPRGFIQHQDVIPDDLIDCIEDIVQLQATVLNKDYSPVEFFSVDNMQASIESRLACQSSACKALGPISECCRLAVYLTCFLTFTDTWNNVLIPCRLSDMLRGLLDDSLEHYIWEQHRALQVWLLLVGSCTANLDQGHVQGLKGKWKELLKRFTKYSSNLPESEMNKEFIISALEDFIYCAEWLRKRGEVHGWFDLQMAFDLPCSSGSEEERSILSN